MIYLVEELQKQGVWQLIMCPFNSEVHRYCLAHHLNHLTYFKGFSANPMVAFRVTHTCKREKIDLIHVHDSHAHNFAVLSAVLTNNPLPVIVSRRVDFPIQGTPMSSFKYNHPQVRRIICVSDAIRQVMEPFIEDKGKLVVVHSGVDMDKFRDKSKSRKLRKEFNIGNDVLLIGNVAALAPHKDYPTFIQVAKRIIGAGIRCHFVAIGDGPSRKEIEQEIRREGMQDNITLTGFRNDIEDILPELDLFLITSETEGLGTSILDALVAGVPVVATRAGGIVEIIEDGVNGLLAPVKDARALAGQVNRMITDREFMTACVNRGKQMVARFSKAETAKQTLRIYEAVLSSPGDNGVSA